MRKILSILTLVGLLTSSAHAVKIADVTRISGQRTNTLTGLGLVYGLKGTGDGGDFQAAMKPLVAMLAKYNDPITLKDLSSASNVALVSITATVPKDGVRNGDKMDCYVTSIGAASSLRGGRLFVTPMTGPVAGSGVFALSQGQVILEDPSSPNVGVIKDGCQMETDLPATYIEAGRFTLILDNPAASWTTANRIATLINQATGNGDVAWAVVVDPKNVIVTIPPDERERPDAFISQVQQLPVDLIPTEARVVVNEKTGTMMFTGDVEISPVVISHKGLTITTTNPPPVASARSPLVTSRTAVPFGTTTQGGAKLQDLVNALDQLKVPAEDRITIIKELYKTGKLHAKLLVED